MKIVDHITITTDTVRVIGHPYGVETFYRKSWPDGVIVWQTDSQITLPEVHSKELEELWLRYIDGSMA